MYSSAGRFLNYNHQGLLERILSTLHHTNALTTYTDSAELDTVLLVQVTRGKSHTYPLKPQPLPVSQRTLLLAVHTPQSIDESFQPVQT
ncbi:hypothetical protein CRENBAI_012024 [Crenichthys baileyi]|uniref:Uncharacterized protein n=1 Tax=Crenichthys baileyi TaxID=28760 RepID=A0AAV9S793_9TELE